MKTCLYHFDPFKPHSRIVKLGFTGYTSFFLFLLENIDFWYSLEPPRRGGSNEYPQSLFWVGIWKLPEFFLSENFLSLVVKFLIYLNRHVFVMQGFDRVKLVWIPSIRFLFCWSFLSSPLAFFLVHQLSEQNYAVVSWRCLFLIVPSVDITGRLYYVILAFPG